MKPLKKTEIPGINPTRNIFLIGYLKGNAGAK